MKTLSQIKLDWQKHNRDNGLSWSEVSTLVDEVAAQTIELVRGDMKEFKTGGYCPSCLHDLSNCTCATTLMEIINKTNELNQKPVVTEEEINALWKRFSFISEAISDEDDDTIYPSMNLMTLPEFKLAVKAILTKLKQ